MHPHANHTISLYTPNYHNISPYTPTNHLSRYHSFSEEAATYVYNEYVKKVRHLDLARHVIQVQLCIRQTFLIH